jgi:hypothetical protein
MLSAVALASGTAAAAPDPDAKMEFRPTMRVNLVNGKTDFSTARFDSYYIRLHDLTPDISGDIKLTFSAPTMIQYYNYMGNDFFNPIIEPKLYSGANNPFPIYADPEYNDGRYDIGILPGKMGGRFRDENAFKGDGVSNPFEVTMSDSSTFFNYIPSFLKISDLLSTSANPEAIVPYVELITSGGKLTGAKVTFVKGGDPNQAVDVSDTAYANYDMEEVEYFGKDQSGYIEEGAKINGNFVDGDFYFGAPPELKNVWAVTVRFKTSSYMNIVHTEYEWQNLLNWPRGIVVVVPDANDVNLARTSASLLENPVTVKAMTGSGIIQNTALTIDGENNPISSPIPQQNYANISSAIAVNEPVGNPGEAILVGKISLPFNEISIAANELPSFSAGNYTVLKYFADGSYVDLKQLGVVDFDTSSKEAKLNASLVIVDGTPGAEGNVTYPSNGNKNYGVKVVGSGNERHLFVYDGNEDGKADDPITLSSAQSSSGSGGGCDTGFGLFGVFALAGVVLLKRRGR